MKYVVLSLLVLLTVPALAETDRPSSPAGPEAPKIQIEKGQGRDQDFFQNDPSACLDGSPETDTRMNLSCSATAQCILGSTVSCTGNTNCSVQHASCSNERGSVKCDGQTTLCPPVCRCSAGCCQNNTCFDGCSGGFGGLKLCFG